MKDLKKISCMIKEKNKNDGASGSCVMHRKDPLYSASNALEQASDRHPKSVCLFIWVVYLFVHIYIYFSFISLIVCLYVCYIAFVFVYLFIYSFIRYLSVCYFICLLLISFGRLFFITGVISLFICLLACLAIALFI